MIKLDQETQAKTELRELRRLRENAIHLALSITRDKDGVANQPQVLKTAQDILDFILSE